MSITIIYCPFRLQIWQLNYKDNGKTSSFVACISKLVEFSFCIPHLNCSTPKLLARCFFRGTNFQFHHIEHLDYKYLLMLTFSKILHLK